MIWSIAGTETRWVWIHEKNLPVEIKLLLSSGREGKSPCWGCSILCCLRTRPQEPGHWPLVHVVFWRKWGTWPAYTTQEPYSGLLPQPTSVSGNFALTYTVSCSRETPFRTTFAAQDFCSGSTGESGHLNPATTCPLLNAYCKGLHPKEKGKVSKEKKGKRDRHTAALSWGHLIAEWVLWNCHPSSIKGVWVLKIHLC